MSQGRSEFTQSSLEFIFSHILIENYHSIKLFLVGRKKVKHILILNPIAVISYVVFK